MLMPEENYGKTKTGLVLTEEVIEGFVAEAEAGYDVATLRRRGRPRMGSGAATTVPVRMDPELRQALTERAERERTSASEIVREALRRYLRAAS
jgi:predicted DNA-binding protein